MTPEDKIGFVLISKVGAEIAKLGTRGTEPGIFAEVANNIRKIANETPETNEAKNSTGTG